MNVIFMGTPEFAVPSLDAVVAAGHRVLAVVAQPDKPVGRGHKLQSPPTVRRAHELGLEVWQPKAVRSGPFPEWVEQAGADVAAVVAYGRILTPRLLAAPRMGCVNVHGSLLPSYRGAAPIQWSVIHGERQTGVCTMRMDEGLDTGDELLRTVVDIGPEETAGELSVRLAQVGANLLVQTLARLPSVERRPQDHDRATLAPLLRKEDGVVDWSWPAQQVHDRVRGTNPWPGGQTVFRGQPLKLWRTRVAGPAPRIPPGHRGGRPIRLGGTRVAAGEREPGAVVEVGGRVVVVACGDGAVELVEVQLPGKRAMSGVDFANGARVGVGERLG